MKTGSTHPVTITGVDGDALGVARLGETTVRVAGGTPGDRLRVRIDHLSPHRPQAWASILEVEERGPGFRPPPCRHAAPLAGRCGGCPALHLGESTRLAALAAHLEATLAPLGVEGPLPVEPSPVRRRYRNRANYVFRRDPSGSLLIGSWAPRSHEVAPMEGCLVVRPPIDRVAHELARLLERSGAPIHPPDPREAGALRYLTVRAGQGGEALVDLVVGADEAPWIDEVLDPVAALAGVVGVAVSVNPSSGNALRVAPSRTLHGRKTVIEHVGQGELALEIAVAAATFTQLNSEVAGRMYRRAAEIARGGAGRRARPLPRVVWDLYCGTGALGMTVVRALGRAGSDATLLGAEGVPATVALAQAAAAANGVTARFEAVDLGRGMPAAWPAPDLVLANPPRRGLDAPVLDHLAAPAGPRRLLYMSCNPKSFARDARVLLDAGFRLERVEAHDMLPGTAHVELLAAFERD